MLFLYNSEITGISEIGHVKMLCKQLRVCSTISVKKEKKIGKIINLNDFENPYVSSMEQYCQQGPNK